MPSPRGLRVLGLVAAGFWVAVAPAGEQEEVRSLLQRMSDAVRLLDYEGTFVYLQNDQLEALHIEHQRGQEQVRERLVSLNGSAREVVREGATVTCILPDSDAVLVDQAMAQGSFPDLLRISLDELAENYRFTLLGRDRVAGRPARVVAIVPRDRLRYGYRLYLDEESTLPLKSDLMDETGKPVEQSMFTSLRVDGDTLARLPEMVDLASEQPSAGVDKPPPATGDWLFSTLPKGFRLDLHERKPNPGGNDEMEHFLLSDGLASLSVFIERGTSAAGLRGGSRMGAASAWGGRVGEHQVTVVGDVPLNTVRLVMQGLQPK